MLILCHPQQCDSHNTSFNIDRSQTLPEGRRKKKERGKQTTEETLVCIKIWLLHQRNLLQHYTRKGRSIYLPQGNLRAKGLRSVAPFCAYFLLDSYLLHSIAAPAPSFSSRAPLPSTLITFGTAGPLGGHTAWGNSYRRAFPPPNFPTFFSRNFSIFGSFLFFFPKKKCVKLNELDFFAPGEFDE